MENNIDNTNFSIWIATLKAKVHSARQKIAFSLNSQVLELYWDIGKEICIKQQNSNWGSNVIDQIATEFKIEFPDMKGFSRRNLYAIRQWFLFYFQRYEFVPHTVAQIPWGHNRLIISKIKDIEEAEFYLLKQFQKISNQTCQLLKNWNGNLKGKAKISTGRIF